jgi:DNA-binding response OmpR family regulator
VNKRILVVDDSELILDAAAQALTDAGYVVEVAREISELLAHTEKGKFDLVLMDVQMPELFGDDIAGVLRHTRGVQGRIYLFSSLATADLAERTRDAGLDGFISKNDGIDAMIARVGEILGQTAQ